MQLCTCGQCLLLLHDGGPELRHVVRAASCQVRAATHDLPSGTYQHGLHEWWSGQCLLLGNRWRCLRQEKCPEHDTTGRFYVTASTEHNLVGAKKRQIYLDITGMSFVAAWLILPAVAWLVIPFNVNSQPTLWPIYSWRLYIAICSIPGFLAGIWLTFLPESPRLLSDTNRGEEALKIMNYINKSNNGLDAEFKREG
ncbi:unnamed protein product [Leptidea sinapis]|uniref:Major facilitator superfamily (MFS) profile domain-containing protein n=1 Tax=Leptidea sinapis TaxID=189913 RepID=A0A5E4R7E3_9NEOP|nr:unnamed protein product [Leptidea sinapis]